MDVGSETQPTVQASGAAFGLAQRAMVFAVVAMVFMLVFYANSVGALDLSKASAPTPGTSTMASGLNTAEATLKRMSDEIYGATQAAYAKASAELQLLGERGIDVTLQKARVVGDAVSEKKTEASKIAADVKETITKATSEVREKVGL